MKFRPRFLSVCSVDAFSGYKIYVMAMRSALSQTMMTTQKYRSTRVRCTIPATITTKCLLCILMSVAASAYELSAFYSG
jgi:hypothetical protein